MIPLITIAQEKLTKNEIYSYWCYIEENRKKIESHFDSTVVAYVDSLKFLKVDTIGIYSESSSPCFILTKEGLNSISPWTAYILWVKNGKSFYQKIDKFKVFKPIVIKDSKLITFYINNKDAINSNRIMPIITDASMNEKGKFRFSTQTSSDYTAFAIYCELRGNSVLKTYRDYGLNIEDDLFYKENNNSIIKRWKELIKNQIVEIEKE